MNLLTSLLIFLVFQTQAIAREQGGDGSLVGNGGDTIYCAEKSGAEFSGYFTLDYLLDFRTEGPYSQLAPVPEWASSRNRILRELTRISPALAQSFEDFSAQMFKDQGSRAWLPRDLSGINIEDEEITKRLPANCYKMVAGNLVPDLRQTVVRRYLPLRIEYLYQKDILDWQASQRPLQFSFFMVHEWLWDLTQNVSDLRRLNWILHSTHLEKMDPSELQEFFRRTGFFSRKLPVCHRSVHVKAALERALGKECGEIGNQDLNELEVLDLSAVRGEANFRAGDFSQLYSLKTLDLSGLPNALEAVPPYGFSDLVNLETVIVRAGGSLPDHLREGARKAKVVKSG